MPRPFGLPGPERLLPGPGPSPGWQTWGDDTPGEGLPVGGQACDHGLAELGHGVADVAAPDDRVDCDQVAAGLGAGSAAGQDAEDIDRGVAGLVAAGRHV